MKGGQSVFDLSLNSLTQELFGDFVVVEEV